MAPGKTWDFATIEDKFELAQDNFDSLISPYKWGQKTITFSFPTSAFTGTGAYLPAGEALKYSAFTATEIAITKAFLSELENVIDIKFVFDATGNGDMKFGHQNMTVGGYASLPWPNSTHEVMVSDQYPIEHYGYGQQTLIHEIGHALGLQHTFDGPLADDLDVTIASIMSYNSMALSGPVDYALSSFMLMDILALQQMYGVSKQATDNDYSLDQSVRVIADYGGNDTVFLNDLVLDPGESTIVDLSRGYIAYDYAGGDRSTIIYDFDAQTWDNWKKRDAANGFYNVTIAPGTVIENVYGSGGTDLIIGAAADESLDGQSGNDFLHGMAGSDSLYGNDGNDKLDGGVGSDWLSSGRGKDRLTGGADADFFAYGSGEEIGKGKKADLITDFTRGVDIIELSSFAGTDGKLSFIGKSGFHGIDNELRYRVVNDRGTTNDITYVEGDLDGNGRADFSLKISGLIALQETDFIL